MKESNLVDMNNSVNENNLDKPNENAFYQEKMKNIIDSELYVLLKNLSSDFCNSHYHASKDFFRFNLNLDYSRQWQEKYKKAYKKAKEDSKGCFNPPNFSWSGNDDDKEFAPFIFFQTVNPTQIENLEAITNYVKQFVYYTNQLLSDRDFEKFVFYGFVIGTAWHRPDGGKNEDIVKFMKKITSDFFTECDEANLKLFKDSGLLYIGEQLFEYNTSTLEGMRFVDYLKEVSAIPTIVLKKLLFDDYFYDRFSSHDNIVDVIIKSIAKTDFSSWSYSKSYKDELSALGCLLDPNNLKFDNTNFYTKNTDGKIKDALINKCAEIFSKPEAKNIKLYDFMTKEPYKNVYSFVSDYLCDNKNKNSPARQNLINGLKTWAKGNDNFIDYNSIDKLTSASYNDYSYHHKGFFPCDKEFNQIIADHCNNAVKNHLKTINDPYERMEKYLSIKSSVEDFFSIKLNIEIDYNKVVGDHLNTIEDVIDRMEKYLSIKRRLKENLDVELSINIGISNAPYKRHGKDVVWLSLWIFLLLVCSGTIIAGFILISITPLKFVCLIMLYPISKIYDPMKEKCIKIHNDRIYNAKLCIYKATSKDVAINNLSWDMLRYDKIKKTLNKQFPDSKDSLDQNQI